MSEYKVPQNVEADDKLFGPFSFRQFIYLLITAAAGGLTYVFYMIFPVLAIIPLPAVIFFGVLALPLKKDQPMETYVAALLSFYLKPRRRLWDPDGVEYTIEITAPRIVEEQKVKNLSQRDAEERFSYLANLVDSEGWAIRSQGSNLPNTAMNEDIYNTGQNSEDFLDDRSSVAQSLDYIMSKDAEKRRQETLAKIRENIAAAAAEKAAEEAAAAAPPVPEEITTEEAGSEEVVDSNTQDAPGDQGVMITDPNDLIPHTEPSPSTSENVVSPDIMELAEDVSVETIAREAKRIKQKNDELADGDVISLR